MKTLSIDIETFSSCSLQKSGVYRYVEAPDFEILLFGYSVDAGPVKVIDLACGEKIPDDVLDALTDSFLYLTASAIAIASKKVQKISRTVLPFRKGYHIFRPFTSFPAESRPEQLALLWWDNRSYSPHRVLCQQYARRRTHGVEYRRTPDSGNGGDRPDIA